MHPLGAKYRAGELNSVPVENCQPYFRWLVGTDLAWPIPSILGDKAEIIKRFVLELDKQIKEHAKTGQEGGETHEQRND